MKELIARTKESMGKAVDALQEEFNRIRTGKATPSLLDGVKVDYYGSKVPIKQVGSISIPEARLILVQPWDKNAIEAIEKGILQADLGLNPMNDGNVIRVPIPQLTEERRLELVKYVRKLAEESRVSIRNTRREANDKLKAMEKEGKISEDEYHRVHDKEIQELTDDFINKIEEVVARKEEEIMEV
jgi:ribosome recycling factor